MASIDQLLDGLAGQLGDKSVFVRGNIPAKKSLSAAASYASQVAHEDVLVLVDDTVFGGAAEGFLITRDTIHVRNTAENPKRIALNEVRSVAFSGGFTGRTITLNERFKLSLSVPSNEAVRQLATFIEQLAQIVAAPRPLPAARQPDAAAARASKPEHSTPKPASAATPLKAITGSIVTATTSREEAEAGKAWLNLVVKTRNDTGQPVARVLFSATACSSQGHIIGSESRSAESVELAPAGEPEQILTLSVDTFGETLEAQLSEAAVYVSIVMEAQRALVFESIRVSKTPVSLTPRNAQEHADRIKVLRSTAFVRAAFEASQEPELVVRMIVQNVQPVARAEAIGIRLDAPAFFDLPWTTRMESIQPGAIQVFESSIVLDAHRYKKAPSAEVGVELVFLEAIGMGWIKHKGVSVEDELTESADEDLLEITSGASLSEEHPESGASFEDEGEGDEDGYGAPPRLEISEIYFKLDASEATVRSHWEGLKEDEGRLYLGNFQDEACTKLTVSKLKSGDDQILAWQIDFSDGETPLDSWTCGPTRPGFKLYGGALSDTPPHRSLEQALEGIAQKFGIDRQIFYWAAVHPEQMTDRGEFLSQCVDDPAVEFCDSRGRLDSKKAKAFLDALGQVWLVYEIHFDRIDFNPLSEDELREGIDSLERSEASWRRLSAFLKDGADTP